MMLRQKEHKSWCVVITKAKAEKKVAVQLQQLGIESFCPTRKEVRQWSDRKKKIEVPLLPSMVLVNIAARERNYVFNVTGVKRYFYWLGKPAKVTEAEIEALKVMEHQSYHSLAVDQLKIGSTINLKDHGINFGEGIVKKISGQQCWVVLQSLGYVIKLQLSAPKNKKEHH